MKIWLAEFIGTYALVFAGIASIAAGNVQGGDEEKLARFRKVRDEIEEKIKRWLGLSEAEMHKDTVAKVR
jgi:UV DNA damage repair endonuclease